MKNLFKYALLFAAATAVSLSLTACSDDDDDDSSSSSSSSSLSTQDSYIKSITETYLEDVVFETYEDMAYSTSDLFDLINAFNTKLQAGTTVTQSEVDAICDKYKEARKYWEQTEAFLYGAASDFNIDPHIDSWPLELATLASVLSNSTAIEQMSTTDDDEAISYARATFTAEGELGFHGIEFIFFRDGEARDVSVFNDNEVESYEQYFSAVTVTSLAEVVYARAAAGDLRDRTYQMEVAWAGTNAPADHISRVNEILSELGADGELLTATGNYYGDDLLLAGTDASTMAPSSWKKVMEIILVDGCSNICAEVADQKMGQAYRCSTGTEEEDDDPNYIESPYSYNSFTDFYNNIVSIQNALYGNIEAATGAYETNSVMGYLYTYNSSEAEALQEKLTAAFEALQTCIDSGTPFVKNPGATCVGDAMDAVNDLDNELNTASSWILAN